MKSFVKPAAALALALGLSACGGKASFPVKVTVTGLQYDGLKLTTNGMDLDVHPPATAGTAVVTTFPHSIEYGDIYDVQVKQKSAASGPTPAQYYQPAHQTCTVDGLTNTDTAGRMAEINVPVTCFINTQFLGGTITGLDGDGLVLTNGSNGGTVTVAKGATTFSFGPNAKVPYNVTYGVTVLTQPKDATDPNNVKTFTCSVSNGSGTMRDDDVNNIVVTCVPNTAP